MRIAIPNRFPPKYVVLYVLLIFAGQQAEGTDFIFALLTATYTALWATAYNVAGGLEYPSGAFILSNGLLSVIVGFGAKVILGEPGQRNMLAPNKTLLVYTVGMIVTLIVAYIVKLLRPPEGLLKNFATLQQLKAASITCLVVGAVLTVFTSRASANAEGSLLSALRQLNQYPIMAILLGTTYEMQASGGRRSANWVVVTSISIYVGQGLINFGKEGMTLGFVAWFIAASIQGYNFKKLPTIALVFGAFFFSYYLAPYSQYVRIYKSETGSTRENLQIAIEYLSDLSRTRELYLTTIEQYDLQDEVHLYDHREGFLDRLIQVAADDNLIDYTDQGHVFGLAPTLASYAGIVPHVIWPSKPTFNAGNIYAHELGILSEDDFTTGISFAAVADAYHQEAWLGVLVLLPIELFLCFMIFDSVTGSAKYSPFALLPILQLFEVGAAAGLNGIVYAFTYDLLALLLIAWVTKTGVPFIMRVIIPPAPKPLEIAPVSLPRSA